MPNIRFYNVFPAPNSVGWGYLYRPELEPGSQVGQKSEPDLGPYWTRLRVGPGSGSEARAWVGLGPEP